MGSIRWETSSALLFVLLLTASGARGRDGAAVYIVTMKKAPVLHHYIDSCRAAGVNVFNKPRNLSKYSTRYGSNVINHHNSLLKRSLKGQSYRKLYSYRYLLNGFAVLLTPKQAEMLSRRKEVASVLLDFAVETATTHTPEFLGLPQGAWSLAGGPKCAGEGVVIGFIDTGIDPNHPSFVDYSYLNSYPVPAHFSGVCEVTRDFPSGSCNRKLVGARHFAASAITRGIFNASLDHASPFDDDGHGTHTASIAAGSYGIPVVVSGHNFGNASGMAPHAHIAVYKALFKRFGGFAADVVAAIDQAAEDNVDIISLSITPNRTPAGLATFFNPIDMALLSAIRAGIFVVQAAGNTGPSPKGISSFSPWIFTVGASAQDRIYNNYLLLGNNMKISGVGLAPRTAGDFMYTLVAATDALSATVSPTGLYLGECQDSSVLDPELVQGKILVCCYSIRFVLGLASVKQALYTASNVSAAGVLFYLDPFATGVQLNPIPMHIPSLIISSVDDSKVFLNYYNNCTVRDNTLKRTINFGCLARILGGLEPNYSNSAPEVMYYSARGPDPEDNSVMNADILKPNLIAPGSSIWGAWSSLGLDSVEFRGENFAMISGTSMAAPHVAGIAALIKQNYPNFSPSAVSSALSTTATLNDRHGNPIMAQRSYTKMNSTQLPATPFDMGNGFVNATAALDPGIIFDCGYADFIQFLCGIDGSGPVVMNYTGSECGQTMSGVDLNTPSITLALLNGSRTISRTVSNIADDETYTVSSSDPYGVSVSVSPARFFIASGREQTLTVILNATVSSPSASFGSIKFHGSRGHKAVIPLSVISKIV